jgi:hypothetical protein
MGGGSYDRDVNSTSSTTGWGNSSSGYGVSEDAEARFTRSYLDPSMDPRGKILSSNAKTPIIVVLDVTGSNVDFAKVVYDKLPMFYGQIEQKGYLDDFEISFCAVGDATCDKAPLQVAKFAKGSELDSWIEKIYLEGEGGGQKMESYELAAYYLLKNTRFLPEARPIIIFIGDEKPYEFVNSLEAKRYDLEPPTKDTKPFKELRQKYDDNVFMILNKYCGDYFIDYITDCWRGLLGEGHLIQIGKDKECEEKAVVDIMLGIIAMASGTRNLSSYKADMVERGQTQHRIAGVESALKDLDAAIVSLRVNGNITASTGKITKTGSKATRL